MLRAVLDAGQEGVNGACVRKAVGDHGLNLTRGGARCAPSICDPCRSPISWTRSTCAINSFDGRLRHPSRGLLGSR